MSLILVVEDEPQVLVLAESLLQRAGHDVITAASYQDAVTLLEQGQRPDLAFIDRNLGEGLTGIDVANAARRFREDIAIIYTSDEHVSDGTKAMFVDGHEFLPKPYTAEQLLAAVGRLLGGKKERPSWAGGRDRSRG